MSGDPDKPPRDVERLRTDCRFATLPSPYLDVRAICTKKDSLSLASVLLKKLWNHSSGSGGEGDGQECPKRPLSLCYP